MRIRSTTVLAVKHGGKLAIAGDGQVFRRHGSVGIYQYAENVLAMKANTVEAELSTLRKLKRVVFEESKKGGALAVRMASHAQVFFNPTGFKLSKAQYRAFLNGKYTLYAVGVLKTTDGNQTIPFCAMNNGNLDAVMACPVGQD